DYQVKLTFDTVIFTRRELFSGGVLASEAATPAARHASISPPARTSADTVDDALASFGATLQQKEKKITLSWKAMEQVQALAPQWDKYTLEAMYSEWAAGKDAADNEDARFLSWVRSVTKGGPPR